VSNVIQTEQQDTAEVMGELFSKACAIADQATGIATQSGASAGTVGLLYPLATLHSIAKPHAGVRPLPPDLLAAASTARCAYMMATAQEEPALASAALAVSDALISLACAYDQHWESAEVLMDKAQDGLDTLAPTSHACTCSCDKTLN
jgi:hypothetical protein